MNSRPRIALISAVRAAIEPAEQAIARQFPSVDVWNILDDRLLEDARAKGGVDPALKGRMRRLIDHAIAEGADGVLLTCSLYGSVASGESRRVPVLAPDEASFADVAAGGFESVLVVATLDSALTDSTARLTEFLRQAGSATRVVGLLADEALGASRTGDHHAMLETLSEACRDRTEGGVLLAQYSLALAAEELATRLGKPVLSGPRSAAAKMFEATSGL